MYMVYVHGVGTWCMYMMHVQCVRTREVNNLVNHAFHSKIKNKKPSVGEYVAKVTAVYNAVLTMIAVFLR